MQGTNKNTARLQAPDFCCVKEALEIVQRLNTSLDPCANFHDFVCMRRLSDINSTDVSPLFRMAVYRANLEYSRGSLASPSGRALSRLHRSCVQQNWRFEVALADFTSAIMSTSKVTARMSAADVVKFLALMSLRYRLPGLVTFRETYNRNSSQTTSLALSKWDSIPPMLNTSCFKCIEFMITTFNAILKVDLKASALMNFHDAVFVYYTHGYNTTNRSLSDSPFRSLSPNAWLDIINEFVYPVYPDAKYIIRETGTDLDDLTVHLAKPSNQPIAVAYLVIQTVMAIYQEFVDLNAFSHPSHKADCSSLVLQVSELQESFEAQIVATPARDDHVREIVDVVRKQVTSDALSSFTFSEEDHLRISETLGSIEVRLPRDVAIADKPSPEITFNFPADLLEARSFGFEVQQEKVRKKLNNLKLQSYMPDVFRRDNIISIPGSMYLMLKFGSKRKLFANLAVLGVRLARELWSFLLENQTWTNKTMQKIQSFQLCFANPDFTKTGVNVAGRSARLMAAALASIVKAASKSNWLHVEHISNSVHMSQGQLFHLVLADSLCGDIIAQLPAEDVNVPAKNTPDFSEVFGCAPDAAMNSNQSLCPV
ncbi:unnamed protein product [Ixodes persulcatus]